MSLEVQIVRVPGDVANVIKAWKTFSRLSADNIIRSLAKELGVFVEVGQVRHDLKETREQAIADHRRGVLLKSMGKSERDLAIAARGHDLGGGMRGYLAARREAGPGGDAA